MIMQMDNACSQAAASQIQWRDLLWSTNSSSYYYPTWYMNVRNTHVRACLNSALNVYLIEIAIEIEMHIIIIIIILTLMVLSSTTLDSIL